MDDGSGEAHSKSVRLTSASPPGGNLFAGARRTDVLTVCVSASSTTTNFCDGPLRLLRLMRDDRTTGVLSQGLSRPITFRKWTLGRAVPLVGALVRAQGPRLEIGHASDWAYALRI